LAWFYREGGLLYFSHFSGFAYRQTAHAIDEVLEMLLNPNSERLTLRQYLVYWAGALLR